VQKKIPVIRSGIKRRKDEKMTGCRFNKGKTWGEKKRGFVSDGRSRGHGQKTMAAELGRMHRSYNKREEENPDAGKKGNMKRSRTISGKEKISLDSSGEPRNEEKDLPAEKIWKIQDGPDGNGRP